MKAALARWIDLYGQEMVMEVLFVGYRRATGSYLFEETFLSSVHGDLVRRKWDIK